jgi:hypothetical protein
MSKRVFLLAWVGFCVCSLATAQGGAKDGTIDFSKLKPSEIVIPIFSEIVVLPYPDGFVGAYEHTNGTFFIDEMVLKGETVDQWTQMRTTTGKQGLSSDPNLTPRLFTERIAVGFKRACPDTFSIKEAGSIKVSGYDAFAAWASCGTVGSAGSAHSESALIVGVNGRQDYLSVQWAERGPASSQPIVYDDAKWAGRLKELTAVKIYPRVPGEAAPKPSGGDQK